MKEQTDQRFIVLETPSPFGRHFGHKELYKKHLLGLLGLLGLKRKEENNIIYYLEFNRGVL
jgi:hypothetical protein|tara:strand:+ start:906 stop:1088 length:183 start_codon:yes stop_codon:yes gene_type:complete